MLFCYCKFAAIFVSDGNIDPEADRKIDTEVGQGKEEIGQDQEIEEIGQGQEIEEIGQDQGIEEIGQDQDQGREQETDAEAGHEAKVTSEKVVSTETAAVIEPEERRN